MSVVASSLPERRKRRDVGALHVLDVALARIHERGDALRDLEPDDFEPRAAHFDGQRQPDVAESHDAANQARGGRFCPTAIRKFPQALGWEVRSRLPGGRSPRNTGNLAGASAV